MIKELAKKYQGEKLVLAVQRELNVDEDTARQMIEFELGDPKLADDVVDE